MGKKILTNGIYCGYDLAVALRTAGFDCPCKSYFKDRRFADSWCKHLYSERVPLCHNRREHRYAAPTIFSAHKWLRDKHNLFIDVSPVYNGLWQYTIYPLKPMGYSIFYGSGIKTYEFALAEGILQALLSVNPNSSQK